MEQKQGKHARLGIGEEEWSLEAEIDEQVPRYFGSRHPDYVDEDQQSDAEKLLLPCHNHLLYR